MTNEGAPHPARPREHAWGLVGYTVDGDEVARCEHPSCLRFRVGFEPATYSLRALQKAFPGVYFGTERIWRLSI